MSPKKIFMLLSAASLFFTACKKEPVVQSDTDPSHMPRLSESVQTFPSGNNYLATLGKVLFYDRELSINHNISCGSCHKQQNAFADEGKFSRGTSNQLTKRNTPSIFARQGMLFWDGRTSTMTDLVLRPVRDEVEMGFSNIPLLMERLAALEYYPPLFKKAFNGSPEIDSNKVKLALAEFMKNFNFSDNKLKHSANGQTPLTASEQMGRDLFFGNARCSSCHHVVAVNGPDSLGNGYGNTSIAFNIGLDEHNPDPGFGAVTHNSFDEGKFVLPVLLNVELTAPYMHDGRFATLEEVVEHYNSGVMNNPNLAFELRDNQGQPQRLNLSSTQKSALVDFLKTLTDRSIVTDPKFSNPFASK